MSLKGRGLSCTTANQQGELRHKGCFCYISTLTETPDQINNVSYLNANVSSGLKLILGINSKNVS